MLLLLWRVQFRGVSFNSICARLKEISYTYKSVVVLLINYEKTKKKLNFNIRKLFLLSHVENKNNFGFKSKRNILNVETVSFCVPNTSAGKMKLLFFNILSLAWGLFGTMRLFFK